MSSIESPDSSHLVQEVTFGLTDHSYPFVGISATENCQIQLERILPREDGYYAEFFTVVGANPDRVLALADKNEQIDPTLLVRREDGGLFEFVVSLGCPASLLAELGALPQEVESTDGTGRIVAEILPGYNTANIINSFLEEHPSAKLVAKQGKDRETPLLTARDLKHVIDERLTERQREVLQAAYEAGYYERPRRTTGEDLAKDLGISTATFSQHIRVAEQNLVAILNGETLS